MRPDEAAMFIATQIGMQSAFLGAEDRIERMKRAQDERERAFGRHLVSDSFDGALYYPELIIECDSTCDTIAEKVADYNAKCYKYCGDYSKTLSQKQYRRILRYVREGEGR